MLSTKDDDERDAEDFLAGYDMSALDDDPFEGSTVNDARGREAADSLERTPDERAELFRSTPTGPTVHSRADGTSERSDPAPRTVALDMEPMRITAAPETPPMEEADFDPEADGTRAALEALLAEQAGEAEYPVEREEDSILRSDQMQGAGEADRVNASPPQVAYPADDSEAVEADIGIDDDEGVEEGMDAEVYGMATDDDPEIAAAEGAVMPSVDDESGFWGMATDEDPELPGSVSPDASSIPGYPADDDEDVEAAMGIDDDESAEEPGGMELAAPSKTPDAGDPSMRLDAGLPTDAEIGGATALDALRFPLHALGAGFSAAAGRSSSPFRSIAGPMREARSEGIEGRLEAKGENSMATRRAAEESAAAERLATIRREPTDLDREREANRAAEASRSAELRARGLDITERGLTDRAAAGEAERSAESAMRDPASGESERARARLSAELDAMASSPRLRAVADAVRGSLDTMSAEDVQRLESSQLLRPFLGRGVGGGGSGGGGGSRDALVQQYMSAGMSEEDARARVAALGATGARAELRTMATEERRGTEDASGGEEILPGVRAGIDLGTGEGRALRTRANTYRDGYRALGEVEALLNRYGAETIINPEIQAELQPAMVTLLAMVAQIQNTGVINPTERPLIEATLPDPSSLTGMSLGRVSGALRGWRRRLDGAASSLMETAGVDEEGLNAGLAWLHSGLRAPGSRRGASSSGPTVRVRDAEGRVSSVPAEAWAELPEEERAGYEVVE